MSTARGLLSKLHIQVRTGQNWFTAVVHFATFISDIDNGIEYILGKFTDDNRLNGAVDTVERRGDRQSPLLSTKSRHMRTQ